MGAIEDNRRYRVRHRERINRERREKRKSPGARSREAKTKQNWRAKTKWERKLTEHLGIPISQAREMISAIQ